MSRKQLLAAAVLFVVSTAVSAFIVSLFAGTANGYEAVYVHAAAFLSAWVLAIAGLILLLSRKTKWAGVLLLGSAAWLIGSYLFGTRLVRRIDPGAHVRAEEAPVPGRPYSIRFKPGAGEAEIESFSFRVLRRSQPTLRPELISATRQPAADGGEAIEIVPRANLSTEEQRQLLLEIQFDPVVADVSAPPPAAR